MYISKPAAQPISDRTSPVPLPPHTCLRHRTTSYDLDSSRAKPDVQLPKTHQKKLRLMQGGRPLRLRRRSCLLLAAPFWRCLGRTRVLRPRSRRLRCCTWRPLRVARLGCDRPHAHAVIRTGPAAQGDGSEKEKKEEQNSNSARQDPLLTTRPPCTPRSLLHLYVRMPAENICRPLCGETRANSRILPRYGSSIGSSIGAAHRLGVRPTHEQRLCPAPT